VGKYNLRLIFEVNIRTFKSLKLQRNNHLSSKKTHMLKLVECPRDAMQGIKEFIPSQLKIEYLKLLLQCGFDTLDYGSFVSPKAIPQMKDSADITEELAEIETNTKLLAIIANIRGAQDACSHKNVDYLGYPFSISETFQERNTKRGIAQAFDDVKHIRDLAKKHDKEIVLYISMGFGNPYGDPYHPDLIAEWVEKLSKEEIRIFSLADTVGTAEVETIKDVFKSLPQHFPELEFGAHFHVKPENRKEKIAAAYEAGCRRFDSAIKGFGGCPMAKDDLTGNLATEDLLAYLEDVDEKHNINKDAFSDALEKSMEVFNYH